MHSRYIVSSLIVLLVHFMAGAQTATVTGIHTFAESSNLAEGKWYKIAVNNNDVYQITYKELRDMGFSDPSRVGVYGFGGHLLEESFSMNHIDDVPEISVYHDTDNSRILFYGQGVIKWDYSSTNGYYHTNNFYSSSAFYFLHQKSDAPKSLTAESSISGNYSSTTVYDDYFLHENDLENIGNTGREMYGESFNYTRTRDFTFSIPGLVAESGSITVDFIANNNVASSLSGSVNGISFINSTISAKRSDNYQFAETLNSKRNVTFDGSSSQTVRLVFNPNSGALKNSYLNYIRLNVKRTLQSYSGGTLFRLAGSGISKYILADAVSALPSLQVWNISDPVNASRIELTTENSRLSFNGYTNTEYALVNRNGSFASVTKVGEIANQNLHALGQTDMVIIAAPKIQEQAQRLAKFREDNDGLTVHVVTPEQIYNEYSSGTPDATAYRLFMKMFYDRSVTLGNPPLYLLLMGDGACDNRGMNTSQWKAAALENCLLTYQSVPSLNETESYVCDDYFGFLDDNEGGKTDVYGQITLRSDVLDLGIGRFPVRTAAQAKTMVDKVIAYSENKELGVWKNNLCFLGDDGDNNTHMRHAQTMVDIIQNQGHHEFNFTKIYLDAYKRESTAAGTAYPDAKKKLFEQLNSGALLMNYSGHGATTSITHEKIFMLSDAETIKMKRLPVWVTATCDFSRFDQPTTTAGEALVLNPDGGAIAMFTTTRVVYSDGNLQINRKLIENIFDKQEDGTRYRMGDIMKFAKRALGSQSNKLNFTLLGDPSLKIAYPEYQMEITEINGEKVKADDIIQFKALQNINVKGRVLALSDDYTEASFNGLVYPTLYDAEETVTAMDNDKTGNPFTFTDRTQKLFTGCDSIRNGEFEFSFIVPKDISYSMESGMMNLYAYSSDRREAQGYFNKYIIGGTSDEVITDTVGPKINYIYLNSTSFRNGDVVNSSPYLYASIEDETGINATGSAIGHDITITIYGEDNSRVKYILNDYFMTNPGNSSSGIIQYSIPDLNDGKYTMELKVWDIFNNSSTALIEFEVNSNAQPVIFDLSAQQNPVRDEARFLLSHNRPETNVNVKIQVFTQMGQLVYENDLTSSSEFMNSLPITWDLRSGAGQRVLPGIYIYRAYLSSDGVNYTTKSKKLIVLGQ